MAESETGTPDARDSEPLTPGRIRYGLAMLTVAYAFNFIDRQILVIVQSPIKAEMGLSDTQLGLLSGFAFAMVYITAGIPIAYWADRGNRRSIISLAITVWSAMTALSGLAQNYTHLLLARIGVGIGEAGGSPPAHSMISDYYPPERRATALSIYSAGLHFGIFAGFLLGAWISASLGWRAAFMLVGLPGVVFAGLFFLTVKEPRRGRWESGPEVTPSLRETVAVLSRLRAFWYIALGTGLTAFAGYGCGNFAPVFLERSHGIAGLPLGVLLAFGGGGGGLVGTLLGGRLADRLGERDRRYYLWVPAAAGALALPLAVPYLLSNTLAVVVPLMVLVTILINTYLGPCLAVCPSLVPPSMRALTSALLFFVLNLIGLGLGPLTTGLLSDVLSREYGDDGLRYAMLIVSAIASLGVLLFVLAARNLPDTPALTEAGQGERT